MSESARRPLRICLVCTGNTCRSPMTEGILKKLASEANIDHWQIDSGGLHAYDGAPASAGAVEAAAEQGVDIRNHRARFFDQTRASECDLILVHSGEHYHRILTWSEEFEGKTFLLKHFPEDGDPGVEAWVADPIGLDLDAYRETYRELETHLQRILPHIEAWSEERG